MLDFQEGAVYQSGFPDFRMKLETDKAEMCGPLVMDDEVPQAMSHQSTGPCHLDLPTNVHPALTQIVDEYSITLFTTDRMHKHYRTSDGHR